jgi:ribokinase
MTKILVCGSVNLETTVPVDAFPIAYAPVQFPFFEIHSAVSGVGYNVAKALTTLGDHVNLLGYLGQDWQGRVILEQLAEDGIAPDYLLPVLEQTPQSVVLYDPTGRRQIFTDVKNLQECRYPEEHFYRALPDCEMVCLTTINFSRPLLRLACTAGRLIATDVQAIADLDDAYNQDFLQAADILFMSHERLPCAPEEWVRQLQTRVSAAIVVVGLGAEGALLAVRQDNFMERLPAVKTRPVMNTVGAGDALYSAFIHGYSQTHDPYQALRQAVVFASYKIGAKGAGEGFLTQAELEKLATAMG